MLSSAQTTFPEARRLCANQDAELLTLEDEYELEAVQSQMKDLGEWCWSFVICSCYDQRPETKQQPHQSAGDYLHPGHIVS